ncbi:MAG: LacI family DNA-binding transcriptional regulator [Caldilineales bacterium]
MATIRDVADRAEVSITSVSHVINNTRPVSEAMRARVMTAMDELGYQPNLLARSLRRGQSNTLGMIVPDNVNPFFAEIARGIEDISFKHGYSLILCNSDANLEKELLYSGVLADKQVDGIIFVAAGLSAEHVLNLRQRQIPVVIADREMPEAQVDSVLANHEMGGWLATRHLLEQGHRRIGCITGPAQLSSSADRTNGYCRALAEAGIELSTDLILGGDFRHESGYQGVQRLLDQPNPPTAVFACNDLMAIGAISGAFNQGYVVPRDLSIIGFDGIPLTSFITPSLTTVAQPMYEMGGLAAVMLLERIRGSQVAPIRQMLNTRLVVRRSTAPPNR